MTWRESLLTRPQAIENPTVPRETIAAWPKPCPVCGAHYKLTPGNRFHIEHLDAEHRRGATRFVA